MTEAMKPSIEGKNRQKKVTKKYNQDPTGNIESCMIEQERAQTITPMEQVIKEKKVQRTLHIKETNVPKDFSITRGRNSWDWA